jgi:CRISPR/Cas system CMR-associated protein Cmr3 (group 5 of RAMP superfamily)
MKEVTPAEFQSEIIEGKINEIMIRKHKPIQKRNSNTKGISTRI